MSHLIPNTLTQIRNSVAVGKTECVVPFSMYNQRLLAAIKDAGYLGDTVAEEVEGAHKRLRITLLPGKIHTIDLISSPGRRVYVGYREMPVILNGFGTIIVSTPKGIMTGEDAKKAQLGGELICKIA